MGNRAEITPAAASVLAVVLACCLLMRGAASHGSGHGHSHRRLHGEQNERASARSRSLNSAEFGRAALARFGAELPAMAAAHGMSTAALQHLLEHGEHAKLVARLTAAPAAASRLRSLEALTWLG